MPRYIDADEVLETMRSNMDMQELYLPTHFIDLVIENMPSADVEPIKHGRWIRGENKGFPEKASMIWYCSVCGERIKYNDTLRTYQKIKKSVSQINPRCRHCGARMDGDSK